MSTISIDCDHEQKLPGIFRKHGVSSKSLRYKGGRTIDKVWTCIASRESHSVFREAGSPTSRDIFTYVCSNTNTFVFLHTVCAKVNACLGHI